MRFQSMTSGRRRSSMCVSKHASNDAFGMSMWSDSPTRLSMCARAPNRIDQSHMVCMALPSCQVSAVCAGPHRCKRKVRELVGQLCRSAAVPCVQQIVMLSEPVLHH